MSILDCANKVLLHNLKSMLGVSVLSESRRINQSVSSINESADFLAIDFIQNEVSTRMIEVLDSKYFVFKNSPFKLFEFRSFKDMTDGS